MSAALALELRFTYWTSVHEAFPFYFCTVLATFAWKFSTRWAALIPSQVMRLETLLVSAEGCELGIFPFSRFYQSRSFLIWSAVPLYLFLPFQAELLKLKVGFLNFLQQLIKAKHNRLHMLFLCLSIWVKMVFKAFFKFVNLTKNSLKTDFDILI